MLFELILSDISKFVSTSLTLDEDLIFSLLFDVAVSFSSSESKIIPNSLSTFIVSTKISFSAKDILESVELAFLSWFNKFIASLIVNDPMSFLFSEAGTDKSTFVSFIDELLLVLILLLTKLESIFTTSFLFKSDPILLFELIIFDELLLTIFSIVCWVLLDVLDVAGLLFFNIFDLYDFFTAYPADAPAAFDIISCNHLWASAACCAAFLSSSAFLAASSSGVGLLIFVWSIGFFVLGSTIGGPYVLDLCQVDLFPFKYALNSLNAKVTDLLSSPVVAWAGL